MMTTPHRRVIQVYFCDGTVPMLARGFYWREMIQPGGIYGSPRGPFLTKEDAKADATATPTPVVTDEPEG